MDTAPLEVLVSETSTLYCAREPRAWYLIPDAAELPPGPLQLRSPRGRGRKVEAAAVAAWRLDDAEGQAREAQIRAEMAEEGRRLLGGLAGGRDALAGLARLAGDAAAGRPSAPDAGAPGGDWESFAADLQAAAQDPVALSARLGELFTGLWALVGEQLGAAPEGEAAARREALSAVGEGVGLAPEVLQGLLGALRGRLEALRGAELAAEGERAAWRQTLTGAGEVLQQLTSPDEAVRSAAKLKLEALKGELAAHAGAAAGRAVSSATPPLEPEVSKNVRGP